MTLIVRVADPEAFAAFCAATGVELAPPDALNPDAWTAAKSVSIRLDARPAAGGPAVRIATRDLQRVLDAVAEASLGSTSSRIDTRTASIQSAGCTLVFEENREVTYRRAILDEMHAYAVRPFISDSGHALRAEAAMAGAGSLALLGPSASFQALGLKVFTLLVDAAADVDLSGLIRFVAEMPALPFATIVRRFAEIEASRLEAALPLAWPI